MEDEYTVLVDSGEGLFKDRGSKFFGYVFPIESEEDIAFYLGQINELHPKARHVCYAFRLGPAGELTRANDDGEPAGSAGKPMLNTLLSQGITNALAIVVRYFGGTLLGVPGLIHAYKEATIEALAQAPREVKIKTRTIEIFHPFELTQPVMRLVKQYQLPVVGSLYEELPGLACLVRLSHWDDVIQELNDLYGVSWRNAND